MNRQQALKQLCIMRDWHEDNGDGPNADYDAICYAIGVIEEQPEKDVLAWLLAYHTKSFDLHGRYLPHEVLGWLIADFYKQYMQEGRTDG